MKDGSSRVACLLLELGADANLATNEAPIDRAYDFREAELLANLLKHGAVSTRVPAPAILQFLTDLVNKSIVLTLARTHIDTTQKSTLQFLNKDVTKKTADAYRRYFLLLDAVDDNR